MVRLYTPDIQNRIGNPQYRLYTQYIRWSGSRVLCSGLVKESREVNYSKLIIACSTTYLIELHRAISPMAWKAWVWVNYDRLRNSRKTAAVPLLYIHWSRLSRPCPPDSDKSSLCYSGYRWNISTLPRYMPCYSGYRWNISTLPRHMSIQKCEE